MADGLLSLSLRGLLMLCLWCVVQNGLGVGCPVTPLQNAIARLRSKTCAGSPVDQDGHVLTERRPDPCFFCVRAHGVVVSHPLRMRKALGSNPSVSIRCMTSLSAASLRI